MENILKAIGLILLVPVMIAFTAFIAGTMLWFVWPVTMVDVFHFPALSWWQSVCLSWVASILIKSTLTTNSK